MRHDPISPWFKIAEELDEFIGIRFGRVAPGTAEPEWMFLRHEDFDGIGGFGELLRRRGAYLPRLPQIKYPANPSWLSLGRALPKYLLPKTRVQWGSLERGAEHSSSRIEPPCAVAWHLFDEEFTTKIRRVCRKRGVTVNSFLLKHLSKAIRPWLADESSVIPWMIPINLRGKVLRDRDTANFTSYVGVKVCSYETVHDIHCKVYAALARKEHWANWYAYKATRFLPRSLKRFMVAHELAMSQWNIGSFSNLGDWDADCTISQPDCGGGWLFAPPVLRCQVLGAGCVTFQNRLSLTIQAHPDLTNSSSVPKAWIQGWVKEVETDVVSLLNEQVTSANSWLTS